MEVILKREFNTEKEIRKYVEENNLIKSSYKCACISLLFNENGEVILQKRGPKSRDSYGMLVDIGGALEVDDKTIREGLKREIEEEVGLSAKIDINDFVVGVLERKYDSRTDRDVNWLFLVYKCQLKGGVLKCNEEGKALSYESYSLTNLPYEKMLDTTIYFFNYYLNFYNKCFSYAMGINERIINLDKNKFKINDDESDYEIIFNKEDTFLYEKFIVENLEVGYWNEYIIDDKIVFMFKEIDGLLNKYVLSEENNEQILNKCSKFAEANFASIRQMFLDTPFYSDKLEGVIFYD